MNKSYKFESREIVLQEVESNSAKVPFAIEQPTGPLSISKAVAVRGEDHARYPRDPLDAVPVDGRRRGRPPGLSRARHRAEGRNESARRYREELSGDHAPRLYGMNANGKVYEVDRALDVNQ